MYENTDARTHRVAAELIEAGVDVDDTYRRLYERVPIEKLRLSRARSTGSSSAATDALVITYITADDYAATGADEVDDRGDHRPPALGRGGPGRGAGPRQAADGPGGAQGQPALDRRRRRRLGDRARARAGAATSARPGSRPTSPTRSWSSSSAPRSTSSCRADVPAASCPVLLCDKPAGVTSHDVVAEVRRDRGGSRPATPAPWTPSPPACCSSCSAGRRGCSATCSLPKTYLAAARLGWRSTTGDPDGELTETGRVPDELELPTGEMRAARADDLRGQGRGRAALQAAHRGEEIETPEREVTVHRAELLESDDGAGRVRDRVLVGHLRPHADRDPRRRLLRGAAAHRRSGRFGVDDAGRELDRRRGALVPARAAR